LFRDLLEDWRACGPFYAAFGAILTTCMTTRQNGYETTGRPFEVTVIAVDAGSRA
jgi:hypothetical protein